MKQIVKTNNLIFFVLVIFIGLAFYYALSFRESKKRHYILEGEVIELRDNLKGYNEKERMKLQMNGQVMNPMDLIDKRDSLVNLSSLVESSKLVFRFSEQFCTPCIESSIESLKELSTQIGKDNIIIITDVGNTRLLNILINNYELTIPCFTYSGKMQFEIEQKSGGDRLPYYFIVDGNSVVSHTCFANENASLITIYFDFVKEMFKR